MGYFLLYESMLDTVLYARDKWLNKIDGRIFPDKFSLNMAGFRDKCGYKISKSNFWHSVYGLNMDEIGALHYWEPTIESIDKTYINTSVCTFFEIDLNTCKPEDAVFSNKYSLKLS